MPPTPKNLPALIRKPVTAGAFPSGAYFTPQPLVTAASPGQGTVKYPPSAPPVITRPAAISQPVIPRVGSITNPAAPVAPTAPAAPDINKQAVGLVQSQIQPIIDEINRSIAARSASGTASIKGYTDAFASLLAQQAGTSGVPYQQAQAQQAGADAALAQRLSGAGTSLGDELRTKLMQADAGAAFTDQVAGQVAGTGQGASNASYATGNASLSDLIARGASAKTYAGSLPGIARLGGLQQTGQYQGQLATELANQLGQVRSKVPGLVSDVTSRLTASQDKRYAADQAAADRAAARADANARSAATIKAQNARSAATIKSQNARAAATTSLNAWKAEQAVKSQQVKDALAQKKAEIDAGYKNGTLSLREYQIKQTHLDRIASIQAQNDRTAASISAANSRAAASIDAASERQLRQLDVAKQKAGQAKLPTPAQITALVSEWYEGKPTSITKPALDENGDPILTSSGAPATTTVTGLTGQKNYTAAYKALRAAGLDDLTSRNYLNAAYKPGERGRGYILREAREALAKAGLPVAPKIVNGHPIITAKQAKVLREAKLLPPGTFTREGVFVITGEGKIPTPGSTDTTEGRRDQAGRNTQASQGSQQVTITTSADRAGVATNPAVFEFVSRVAQAAGRPLQITTGTNHTQNVAGTNRQSEHWRGNAADIAATGADLIRMGQAALIAAGMGPAEARTKTGGLFNVNGYQVIFNTHEGGDHTNHLHVGVGRAGTSG